MQFIIYKLNNDNIILLLGLLYIIGSFCRDKMYKFEDETDNIYLNYFHTPNKKSPRK